MTGGNAGPFTITFNNGLAGINVPQLTATAINTTVALGTTIDGGTPFPALNGFVHVFGAAGGPFTFVFDNAALAAAGLRSWSVSRCRRS